MSKRSEIVDEIKMQLDKISIANGFDTDVKLVESSVLKLPTQVASKIPALFIVDENESKTDEDCSETQSKLNVLIVGYVKKTTNKKVLPQQRSLLSDVEKAICEDRTLNSKVYNTIPKQILTDKGTSGDYGIFNFTFEITYSYQYGNP